MLTGMKRKRGKDYGRDYRHGPGTPSWKERKEGGTGI